MGIAYRTQRASGLAIGVLDGEITPEQYYEFAARQDADPDWHASTRSLIDARTVLTPAVLLERVAALADVYAEMRADDPPSRNAIVAGHDFALARGYGELRTSAGTLTIAFSDLESACIWLEADLDEAQRTIAELRDELRETASA
jgi:hypothetical protein